MRKKRILISVTNDISYDQRMLKTAHTLVKNGWDVTIVGRWKKHTKEVINPSYNIVRFSMLFHQGKFFYLEYNFRLFLYLLFHSFDRLCAVDLDTIIPNIMIGKLKNIKVIYDAHEYFTEVPELVGRDMEKKIWKSVERFSIPKCYKIYTVSSKIAELFEEEYKKPCEVIYNVPLKKVRNTPIESTMEPKIVIYQGDLNIGRGLEPTIQAFESIDAQFWIVGDGLIYDKLARMIKELNLENKVFLKGKWMPLELDTITQKAYIGLNLLENKGLNYYFSLANKFFDYIQFSIPSINMNFPEYQKIVSQYSCALLIDDLEVDTIKNALNRLLSDEKLYSDLRKNCDIARSNLHWEIQEEKMCSIYN